MDAERQNAISRTKEFRHRHACDTSAVRGHPPAAALHAVQTRAWAAAQWRRPKTHPPANFPGFGADRPTVRPVYNRPGTNPKTHSPDR